MQRSENAVLKSISRCSLGYAQRDVESNSARLVFHGLLHERIFLFANTENDKAAVLEWKAALEREIQTFCRYGSAFGGDQFVRYIARKRSRFFGVRPISFSRKLSIEPQCFSTSSIAAAR